MSLALMGMYFSGNPFLQNLVAPTMETMPLFSAREFGMLEMLQNFFLLGICLYATRCFFAANNNWVKLFSFLLILVSIFTLLEEIDYGAHFFEYFTGQHGSLAQETWDRNLHNRISPTGEQYGNYMKLAVDIAILAGFVLGPLFLRESRFSVIRLVVPSRWMISTVILIVMLSIFAHSLEDAGYSIISGVPGNLDKNISEFRELNLYFLFLLYSVQLHQRIIIGNRASPE
jgi:hypothetical protein